jgi:hypothetical protein
MQTHLQHQNILLWQQSSSKYLGWYLGRKHEQTLFTDTKTVMKSNGDIVKQKCKFIELQEDKSSTTLNQANSLPMDLWK